ncbi:MAG: hypothetical protein ABIV05_04445 [Actinomycetota bacterium]
MQPRSTTSGLEYVGQPTWWHNAAMPSACWLVQPSMITTSILTAAVW